MKAINLKFFLCVLACLLQAGALYPKSVVTGHEVAFTYAAPDGTQSVSLAGTFNGWDMTATPMENVGEGIWKVVLDLPDGEHQYKFVLDGQKWETDPDAPKQTEDAYKNAIVQVGRKKAKNEVKKMKRTVKLKRKIEYDARSSEHFYIVEGESIHYMIRDDRTRVAAHITVPISDDEPQIIVSFPAGESSISFRTSRASWDVKEIDPYLNPLGGEHGVSFKMRAGRKKIKINLSWTILHNILNLRHILYYSPTHEDYPKELIREGAGFILMGAKDKFFIRALDKIPQEQAAIFQNSSGITLDNLKKRNVVRIRVNGRTVSAFRETLDGIHRYELELRFPEECEVSDVNEKGEIEVHGKQDVEVTVRASTNFLRPTPVPMEEVLTSGALQEAKRNPRFHDNVRNFSFLVFQEKLLAGSWFYLVHYGRDTLNAARLMWKILSENAKRVVVLSVLNRISDDGSVAVVEELHDWPVHLALGEFNGKIAGKDFAGAVKVLSEIVRGKRNVQRVYNVLDATFMLPIVTFNFLSEIPEPGQKSFFEEINERKETNLESVLRNIDKVLSLTDPYVQTARAKDLVRLMDSAGDVGNWRDSGHGLAWGKYPADMNVSLAFSALASAEAILQFCTKSFGETFIDTLTERKNFSTLKEYLNDSGRFKKALSAWKDAGQHFEVHLSSEEISSGIERYLKEADISMEEKKMVQNLKLDGKVRVKDFLEKGILPDPLKNGVTFTAISLDKEGKPLPVIHSDEVYTLLDRDLPEKDVEKILEVIFLPYPVGLMSEAGMFVANAIYQPDKNLWGNEKWEGLGRNAYHGSVVWGWPMRALVLGLCRQIQHGLKSGFPESTIGKWVDDLKSVNAIEEKVGHLTDSELWTWEPSAGKMKPIAFGMGRPQPSTPVQLWSGSAKEIVVQDTMAMVEKFRTQR